MELRLGKSEPSYPPTVYVQQRRRDRNKRQRLRNKVVRMKRWIERALNVRPGDLGRGVLLCSCLFLVICSYKIGGVAGAAPFLSPFPAHAGGFAQIVGSLLVAVMLAGQMLT